jgi:predicted ATP-dependent protease
MLYAAASSVARSDIAGGSMPYVMVPVPEEHVQDVMQFILREMAKASLEPWDTESVSELFHEVDEAGRSLLAYTARASMSGTDITEAQAADMMQLRQREVAGIVRDLNERATKANRPILMTARSVTEALPNGRTTEKRVLWMSDELAPLVRDAERAELAEVRSPLGPTVG